MTDAPLSAAPLVSPDAETSTAGPRPRTLPAPRRRGPSPRYLRMVQDESVRRDLRTLALFVRIYCDGNHRDRERAKH